EVSDPARMPEIMQRALRISVTGRPGPVVISLPEDILKESIEPVHFEQIVRPSPMPAKSEQDALEKILQNAERPVLIVGGGIKNAATEQSLLTLSEQFNLPTFVSFRRHDIFPHNNQQFIGHLGLGESKHVQHTFNQADVIIALGTRLSEVTTKDYTLITPHHKLIHIDIDNSILGKTSEPTVGIVSCAKQAIDALLKLDITVKWNEWTETLRDSYLLERKTVMDQADSLNTSIILALQQKLPNDSILTNDAGNFASWLHQFFIFKGPHTYVGPTSGAMGYGLPAAIGAKLAHPEKTVVALAGDGGFMMTVQELETAIRYKIPVICLVFNNKMYGTIRMYQEIHYPRRIIGTELGDTSYSGLAKSLGAAGHKVTTKEEFTSALEQAMKNDTVTVIEIMTDPDQISVTKTIEQIRRDN